MPRSVEKPLVRREKRLAVPAQEKLLLVSEEPRYVAASAQESFPFEAAIRIITEKLDRLHSLFR